MSDSHSSSIQFTAINPESQQMARKRARPDSPPPAQHSDEDCEDSSWELSSADLTAERKREKKRQQRKARRARKQASSSASSSYDGEPPIVDLTGEEEEDEQSDDSIQRNYFQPYQFPSMSREEDRVMFDMEERALRIYPTLRPAAPPVVERVCTICCSPGHSNAACPELLCQHCGEHNKHFSRACPHPRASSPSSTSSRSTLPPPPAEYDWRSETPRTTPPQRGILKAYCYNCAGSGHYGYDCPDISRSRRGMPGIFSGVIALEYVSETDTRSLPEYNRDTKTLKVCKNTGFGRSARMEEIASGLFDPFREYRLSADGRSYQAYTSEYRNSMYGRSGSGMERRGGGGRNLSSRQYIPERQGGRDSNRDTYRPMPSAAQTNWRQYRR